ncbi:phage holin family protein [Prosthecomicrobium sp. N25]|uniref:phage holin family protein n=1 Tax=Prosthecomicrobium sp. N25 TaxID=3129254 RepID=UPI003077BF4A
MDTQRSVIDLFGDLVDQMSTLFRKEIQLAKTEMTEKAGQFAGGAAQVGVGGVLLLAALLFFLHAVVAWLDYAGLDPRWGFLIVAILVGAGGYLMLNRGKNEMKATNLTPVRTTEQLQRDAAVVKEQVR